MSNQNKVYEIITNEIIKKLEEGTVPWNKPWNCGQLPINLVSKKAYRGINIWLLGSTDYTSPYWLSYKQVIKLKGQVKDEELKNSSIVAFFQRREYEDAETKEIKVAFIFRYYRVYNVEQCTDLEKHIPKTEVKELEFTPIELCEQTVKKYTTIPEIKHSGDRACYSPSTDIVTMPNKKDFHSTQEYYSTLFHELGHSTGHSARLNRKGIVEIDGFGSEQYSKEELIAEFTASFLCGITGIKNKVIKNSAAYIKSWISQLKDNPRLILTAAQQAQKAADYIQGIKHTNYDKKPVKAKKTAIAA